MKPINEMSLAELADDIEYEIYGHPLSSLTPHMARLRELHKLTRWIPASERLPTPEDGYQIHVIDGFGIAFTIMQKQWDNYEPTHWKRIDKP